MTFFWAKTTYNKNYRFFFRLLLFLSGGADTQKIFRNFRKWEYFVTELLFFIIIIFVCGKWKEITLFYIERMKITFFYRNIFYKMRIFHLINQPGFGIRAKMRIPSICRKVLIFFKVQSQDARAHERRFVSRNAVRRKNAQRKQLLPQNFSTLRSFEEGRNDQFKLGWKKK